VNVSPTALEVFLKLDVTGKLAPVTQQFDQRQVCVHRQESPTAQETERAERTGERAPKVESE
jgi:hypothetical protein